MKKLFTNYNFQFDKNEKKILNTFLKQTLKQTQGDAKFASENKAFSSIQEKLNAGTDEVKLTKDELTRLKFQLENNLKYLKKEAAKAGWWKRWIYKSMLTQYDNIINNHFKG